MLLSVIGETDDIGQQFYGLITFDLHRMSYLKNKLLDYLRLRSTVKILAESNVNSVFDVRHNYYSWTYKKIQNESGRPP